jgi:hypothetical protein
MVTFFVNGAGCSGRLPESSQLAGVDSILLWGWARCSAAISWIARRLYSASKNAALSTSTGTEFLFRLEGELCVPSSLFRLLEDQIVESTGRLYRLNSLEFGLELAVERLLFPEPPEEALIAEAATEPTSID